MKCKLLITMILFCCIKFTAGQPFSYYINHTSKWACKFVCGAPIPHAIYFTYTISGDTIIGGQDYFKLHKFGIDTAFIGGNQDTVVDPVNEFVGAIREDAQHKLYFIPWGGLSETLVFEYNMFNGMQLPLMQSNSACLGVGVTYTDTVFLGPQPLRRYHLSSGFYIIEGVGAEGGLIEDGSVCMFWDVATYLICYEKDGNTLIINNTLPCDFFDEISEIPDQSFLLYPNPSSAQIHIDLQFQNGAEILLTDAQGTILFKKYFKDKEAELNVSRIENGLYFITIKSDEGVVSRKVIIQH